MDPGASRAEVNAATDRRGRRQRRRQLEAASGTEQEGESAQAGAAGSELTRPGNGRRLDRELRRQERRGRPRAPRAELGTATLPTDAASGQSVLGSGAGSATQGLTATEALALELAPGPKRGSHYLARARKKQRSATAAVGAAEDNPALGALNRHLNMLMHQLATSHRVIGRIAAERDALRQQLADLQGIPVDEISVTTIGASAFEDLSAKTGARRQAAPPTTTTGSIVAKLNYFNVDDVAIARKRRQMLVLGLLTVIVVLWVTARIGWWVMPAGMSRESLGNLPYIGDLVTLFLAGWIFYRIVRVSSRGVRWIFPSEEQRRRRR